MTAPPSRCDSASRGERILIEKGWGETRIAVLDDDDCVIDCTILRRPSGDQSGSEKAELDALYCGRIRRIDGAAGGAFVDLGGGLGGFLRLGRGQKSLFGEGTTHLLQIRAAAYGHKVARVVSALRLFGWFVTYTPAPVRTLRSLRRSPLQAQLDKIAGGGGKIEEGRRHFTLHGRAAMTTTERVLDEARGLIAHYHHYRDATQGNPRRLYGDDPLCVELRRLITPKTKAILCDDAATLNRLHRNLMAKWPEFFHHADLDYGRVGLFERYGADEQIEAALDRIVPLPGGAVLTIDETEALTAIDVDSGRFVGQGVGALKRIDLEAAKSAVRQIRLRNLGGLIVIDFLSLHLAEARGEIIARLKAEVATIAEEGSHVTKITAIDEVGVVIVTRSRRGVSLGSQLMQGLPQRYAKSIESCVFDCLRGVRRRLQGGSVRSSGLRVVVSKAMLAPLREAIVKLGEVVVISLEVEVEEGRDNEAWEITARV